MKKLFTILIITSCLFIFSSYVSNVKPETTTVKKQALEIYLVANQTTRQLTWTYNFQPERAWLIIERAPSANGQFKFDAMGELEEFNEVYQTDGKKGFFKIETVYNGEVFSNTVELK